MESLKFTVILLDDENRPFAATELHEPTPGMTRVDSYIQDDMAAQEICALLMIAASASALPHQRVKLLAMISEISAGLEFDHFANPDLTKD